MKKERKKERKKIKEKAQTSFKKKIEKVDYEQAICPTPIYFVTPLRVLLRSIKIVDVISKKEY